MLIIDRGDDRSHKEDDNKGVVPVVGAVVVDVAQVVVLPSLLLQVPAANRPYLCILSPASALEEAHCVLLIANQEEVIVGGGSSAVLNVHAC